METFFYFHLLSVDFNICWRVVGSDRSYQATVVSLTQREAVMNGRSKGCFMLCDTLVEAVTARPPERVTCSERWTDGSVSRAVALRCLVWRHAAGEWRCYQVIGLSTSYCSPVADNPQWPGQKEGRPQLGLWRQACQLFVLRKLINLTSPPRKEWFLTRLAVWLTQSKQRGRQRKGRKGTIWSPRSGASTSLPGGNQFYFHSEITEIDGMTSRTVEATFISGFRLITFLQTLVWKS